MKYKSYKIILWLQHSPFVLQDTQIRNCFVSSPPPHKPHRLRTIDGSRRLVHKGYSKCYMIVLQWTVNSWTGAAVNRWLNITENRSCKAVQPLQVFDPINLLRLRKRRCGLFIQTSCEKTVRHFLCVWLYLMPNIIQIDSEVHIHIQYTFIFISTENLSIHMINMVRPRPRPWNELQSLSPDYFFYSIFSNSLFWVK